MSATAAAIRHSRPDVNGIRLHVAETGEGPPVMLLHGFPDFWFGWRHQMDALARAGYRAVAPDLRGYGESDVLADVASYRIEALMTDVAGLVGAIGEERVSLVAHDWGGVIAWYAAMHHPELFDRLVILNAPHPRTYRRELKRVRSLQLLRSWYVLMFQLPVIPEILLSAGRQRVLQRVWRGGPAPDDTALEAYRHAFERPGVVSAGVNYYRAAGRYGAPRTRKVEVPTLVINGDRDPYLGATLVDGLEAHVSDLHVTHIPDAGHWLHHSHSDEVNDRILGFLGKSDE